MASCAWCSIEDSLLQELDIATSALDKADILNELSKVYYIDTAEVQLRYAKLAHDMYQKSTTKNDSLLVEIYYYKGSGYERIGKSNLALESFKSCLELAQKLDNQKTMIARIYTFLGIVYDSLGRLDEAVRHYHMSIELAEEIKDSFTYMTGLNNIGHLYLRIGEYDKAEDIFYENLILAKKTKYFEAVSITHSNLGVIAHESGALDKAINHYQTALRLADSLYTIDIHSLLNLGDIYMEKGENDLAYKYYYDAYEISNESKIIEQIPKAGLSLAEWYYNQGDYQQSLMYGKVSLKAAQELDSRENLFHTNENLSKSYEALGDYKKAFYHYKEFKTEQDSFLDQEKIKSFAELEFKYAGKKRETENLFLKKEQQKNNTIIEQQRIIFVIGSILFLSLVLGLRSLWRKNKKEQEYNVLLERQVKERTSNLRKSNEKLITANKELEQFAYITSHDLKEPLRNISGFSSLILRKINNGEFSQLAEYLQYINNSTHQMNNLIEDILAYSKIGNSEETAYVSISNLVQKVERDLHLTLKEKKARIVFNLDQKNGDAASIFLPPQLSLVFKNLIENGIKYNDNEEPTVEINYDKDENNHIIRFRDNGFGIEPKYQDLVFEMFKRLHNRAEYEGSGIGLAICKKISVSLGGTLTIINSTQDGTTFELTIPVIMSLQTKDQLVLADH